MAIADRCPVCDGVLLESDTDFRHTSGCILKHDSKQSVIEEGIRKDVINNIQNPLTRSIERLKSCRLDLRRIRRQLR